jgi:hypothetical protein
MVWASARWWWLAGAAQTAVAEGGAAVWRRESEYRSRVSGPALPRGAAFRDLTQQFAASRAGSRRRERVFMRWLGVPAGTWPRSPASGDCRNSSLRRALVRGKRRRSARQPARCGVAAWHGRQHQRAHRCFPRMQERGGRGSRPAALTPHRPIRASATTGARCSLPRVEASLCRMSSETGADRNRRPQPTTRVTWTAASV